MLVFYSEGRLGVNLFSLIDGQLRHHQDDRNFYTSMTLIPSLWWDVAGRYTKIAYWRAVAGMDD